ncbi:cobaltochelatase subunit CobN [Pyrodictium occultum]|nr:cobaltochelatase subunit CobN [Pyrodictium occultum]
MGSLVTLVIGYDSPVIELLRRLGAEMGEAGQFIRVFSPNTLEGGKGLDDLRSSRVIFLYTHRLPKEAEEAIASSSARFVIPAGESYAYLARGEEGALLQAMKYFRIGGEENLGLLLRYLLYLAGLVEEEPPPPREIPLHGVWHPKLGVYEDIDDYLRDYYMADKPLIGILYYRSLWLYGNRRPLEALIDALETEGLGVIPVFTQGYRDSVLGGPSAEDTIRSFFLGAKGARIDVLIDMLSFFLLDHGSYSRSTVDERFRIVRGVELLQRLGVPVLKPIREWYQSEHEWLENPQGVNYLTQVYEVIMPEVDGAVEPIVISTSTRVSDYRKHIPYEPHVRLIARRVKRWVILRRKKPSERRIAIILNNPPCRQLEASIGVGFGLDVPESLVRFLHRLRSLGYYTGEGELPKTGDELIHLILERRATSEFRWTPVEEIVRRGGYLDMVDLDTYMKWFMELPEEARKVMLKWWGDPRDILSGKVKRLFAGAVYNGKFVIPGIRFGNIVIMPQPKFGCAGALCDGRVCKILHNPTIPPPHQWLAAYRWVTRIFRADVMIHWGTHGYLEFRPGKGVGLSPYCWPEITVDDIPFLYIYNVTNPMEGVMAKRRGYAVIIDHAHPPYMKADTALEELDELLEEYSRAKSLGEEARAKVIFEQIVEKARERGIDVGKGSPDKITERLHEFLDETRGSTVENGLHVFGETPSDPEKLAEHVAAIMSWDTGEWISIERAVATLLGLDYDKIVSKPSEFCKKLGVSNRKAREILHSIAVRVLEKLLSKDIDPDMLSFNLLQDLVAEAARGEGVKI